MWLINQSIDRVNIEQIVIDFKTYISESLMYSLSVAGMVKENIKIITGLSNGDSSYSIKNII